MMVKPVLDPCCGSRMMWFDKDDDRAIFGDIRREKITVKDRSHSEDGTRQLRIEPDQIMDFRNMPFADGTFKLVAFDPPHLERAGPLSWMAAKYGKLSDDWRNDLRLGFYECFRVLESGGVLVFKWNEVQVKLSEVLSLTHHKPLFGQISGRSGMTHWIVFMKPDPVEAQPERDDGLFSSSVMHACPTCGNKRCPHANDLQNPCTNSNEPGQPGSNYPKVPA